MKYLANAPPEPWVANAGETMSCPPVMQAASVHRTTVANRFRRLLAAASILVLAGIGLRIVRQMTNFPDRILSLYLTVGPASIYAFGYFYWLPDILGARIRVKGSLFQRWSIFVRLAAAGAVTGWIAWVVASAKTEYSSGGNLHFLILLFVVIVPSFLTFASAVATEQYLACRISGVPVDDSDTWYARLTNVVGYLGSPITKFLKPRRSVSIGSVLVLASLLLNITLMDECGNDPHKGYEIVSGKAVWVTAQMFSSGVLKVIASQVARGIYILDILIAALCVAALLAGMHGNRLIRTGMMVSFAGVLALFAMCDFTLGWARMLGLPPGIWALMLFICACIVPPTLWLWRATRTSGGDHTCVALMVALLPVLYFTLIFGCYTAIMDPDMWGLESFLLGMLLLWWGLVKNRWEETARRRFVKQVIEFVSQLTFVVPLADAQAADVKVKLRAALDDPDASPGLTAIEKHR